MKPNVNQNRNGLARKLLLVCGVFVVTATVVGAGMYSNSVREIDSSGQDSTVLDRLVQARKFNLLIQELNSGHVAEARRFLNIALASDIRQVNRQAATANPTTAAEAKFALAEFARAEKAHPKYYTVEQRVKAPVILQIARHDAVNHN
jgi:hypothetical protein